MNYTVKLSLALVFMSGCIRVPLPVAPIGSQANRDTRSEFSKILFDKKNNQKNIRGLYQCELEHGHGYSQFREAIVAAPEQGLRLETLSTGAPYSLALYVFKNKRGILIIPPEKKIVQFSDSEVPLSPDLTLPIKPILLSEIFLGYLTLDDADQVYESAGRMQVVTAGGIEAFFGAELHDLESFVIRDAEGVGVLKGTFENFLDINGVVAPQKFALVLLEEDATIRCEAQLQSVNETIKDSLFEVSIPQGWNTNQ